MNRTQRRKKAKEEKKKKPLTMEQLTKVMSDMHNVIATMVKTLNQIHPIVAAIPRSVYNEKIHAELCNKEVTRIINEISIMGIKKLPIDDIHSLIIHYDALDFNRNILVKKVTQIHQAIIAKQPKILDRNGKEMRRIVHEFSGNSEKSKTGPNIN